MGEQHELAKEILREIALMWEVEGKRVRWISPDQSGELGFDWWPGDFRVRLRAYPFNDAPPGAAFNVTVRTDFLRDIALASSQFVTLAAMVSKFSAAYAWVYAPATLQKPQGSERSSAVWLQSSCYIARENKDWMPLLLAQAGLVQAIHAQIQVFGYPEIFGSGTPDISFGTRRSESEFDGILDFIRQRYVPEGQRPSRWAGAGEFEKFSKKWGVDELWLAWPEPASLTIVTSFGSNYALVKLDTEARHPQLGHGLLATLRLPTAGDVLSLCRAAAELNYLEATSWTGFPQLGCWYVDGRGDDMKTQSNSLDFAQFIPNASYQSGYVTHVAAWLLHRVRWAREQQFPGMRDEPIVQILERRGEGVRRP